ncbi:MAG: hypothetical protein NTX56_17865 [Proteobacteria bacterium]|nr:hypothetical protein [Pseudomonadota bacterium]
MNKPLNEIILKESIVTDGTNAKSDIKDWRSVPSSLPCMFRVETIEREPVDLVQHKMTARLFHEDQQLSVQWISRQVDVRIHKGSLVAIRWHGHPVAIDGTIRISRLVLMEIPTPSFNLFRTVPLAWVHNRDLVERAADLWEALPRGFQHLFNAILWDGNRFQRFGSEFPWPGRYPAYGSGHGCPYWRRPGTPGRLPDLWHTPKDSWPEIRSLREKIVLRFS